VAVVRIRCFNFWFKMGGDGTKHYQKMKRRQRARFGSMGRKCDTARQHDNVGWRRSHTEERKGRRRC
jgi:hypothetical protein